MNKLTEARLKEVLHYDPENGIFSWSENRKKCSKGALAGSVRSDGYVTIRIDYHRYYAHRIAWLYMTGQFPAMEIDHKDGNPSNNVWSNLREATPRQNMQNRPAQQNNKVGLKGVRKSGRDRYHAMIKTQSGSKYLGTFGSAEAAHEAYKCAASDAFGEFARFE